VIGSTTRPASYCGCIGFKASVGALNRGGDPNCTVHTSLLGIPAITLPVLQDEGLPLGLQIAGFVNGDAQAFATAAALKALF
jgi:Asp-tRNA(Asn)/Glu-tRNA(Gln) amidotransferase A subunit family amidase